jgi:hypothetical protein
LESSQKIKVHQGDLPMFKTMVQELLNIEQFCHWKFNKVKTKNFEKIGASSWHCWKILKTINKISWR